MKISMSILKIIYLFGVVLLIMIARGLPLWILSLLIIIALAAPLIRENMGKTDLDERQIAISHLSSHIAFFVLIGLLLFVMLKNFVSEGINPNPEWYMLLLIPLIIKLLIVLFQNYGPELAARRIGYFFAAVFLLFLLLSHGFTLETVIEMVPFILIVLVAWLSKKSALVSGIGFLLLAIGLTLFFRGWLRLDIYVRLMMYSMIPLPLLVSGIALLVGTKNEELPS